MSKSSTASKLDSLVGLRAAKTLIRELSGPALHIHATLLYGSRGAGKSALARALSEAWLCVANTGTGACGECKPCLSFEHDRSADFLRVSPQPPSNLIRVSAIRPSAQSDSDEVSIDEFFRTGPLSAKSKVVWIDDAERMNSSAANALLKTLEEPPPYGRFVLTTSAVGLLPATVVSRCVAVACELPTREELATLGDADDDLALIGEGAPGVIDQIRARRPQFQAIRDFAKELQTRSPAEALVAAERFRELCDGLMEALDWTARAAQARVLETLARCVLAQRPDWVAPITEAHRRILGNGYAPAVFDALFTDLLVEGSTPARIR